MGSEFFPFSVDSFSEGPWHARIQTVSQLSPLYKLEENLSSSLKLTTLLTHLCRVASSTCIIWTGPFQIEWASGWYLLLPCFVEISVFNANSVDLHQMPHSVASDLSLHCLPMHILHKNQAVFWGYVFSLLQKQMKHLKYIRETL